MVKAALTVLVQRRKTCRFCVDRNPGEIYNGAQFDFDPETISYWSQWLGHLRPSLLIVGQDFGNLEYFQRFRGRDEPHNTTNNNLRRLLAESNFMVGPAPAPDLNSPVFLTNSVLCLKATSMSVPIRDPWVRACASLHCYRFCNFFNQDSLSAWVKAGWLFAQRLACRIPQSRLARLPEAAGEGAVI